jgi:hypothetical protein
MNTTRRRSYTAIIFMLVRNQEVNFLLFLVGFWKFRWVQSFWLINLYFAYDVTVPDHDGGRRKQINAWFLYTLMVYL